MSRRQKKKSVNPDGSENMRELKKNNKLSPNSSGGCVVYHIVEASIVKTSYTFALPTAALRKWPVSGNYCKINGQQKVICILK